MGTQSEQGQSAPERIHSPSEWAARLQESSKIAPEEEEQSLAPQDELSEEEVETETEEPTSQEDQDENEETELEADAEQSDETEPSKDEPTNSPIVADATYIIDGEEIDGQTVINGIAATKNFAQEKHRLRTEAEEEKNTAIAETNAERDKYAASIQFNLGMNQDAMRQYQNINWVELQSTNPAEYQRLQGEQGKVIQHQQQLQGQFDQFLTKVQTQETERQRASAATSLSILHETFGGQEGWSRRYSELRSIASDAGFNDAEFNVMTDYRMMNLLDRADKAEKKLTDIESNVKKKTANPVKMKNKRNSARVNTTQSHKTSEAHATFLKSGKPQDAAKWLMQSQEKRR